jgi:hypothetical protein
MRSLSTELRSAVMQVLIMQYGYDGLTDEDFAFLGIVSTYAQSRESGSSISAEALRKVLATQTAATADRAAAILPTKAPNSGPKGAPGDVGFAGEPIGATGPDAKRAWDGPRMPQIPSAPLPDTGNQEDLPLGTADRGPEPQDMGTLLSTEPPPFDPADPPPDYTQLDTARTRRIDS